MMVKLHIMNKVFMLQIETCQLDSLLLLLLLQLLLLSAALLRLQVHH